MKVYIEKRWRDGGESSWMDTPVFYQGKLAGKVVAEECADTRSAYLCIELDEAVVGTGEVVDCEIDDRTVFDIELYRDEEE